MLSQKLARHKIDREFQNQCGSLRKSNVNEIVVRRKINNNEIEKYEISYYSEQLDFNLFNSQTIRQLIVNINTI